MKYNIELLIRRLGNIILSVIMIKLINFYPHDS